MLLPRFTDHARVMVLFLITTKRGKSGKPQLSYDYNFGLARPTRVPQMSDAGEYATIRNELQIYDNVPTGEWNGALTGFNTNGSYTTTKGDVVNAVFTPTDIQKFKDGSDPLVHPNTNWFKEVIKPWSPQQRHNVQLMGGGENVKYLTSLGYLTRMVFTKTRRQVTNNTACVSTLMRKSINM